MEGSDDDDDGGMEEDDKEVKPLFFGKLSLSNES